MVTTAAGLEQREVLVVMVDTTCILRSVFCGAHQVKTQCALTYTDIPVHYQVHRALFRKEGEGKERERKKITTTSTA